MRPAFDRGGEGAWQFQSTHPSGVRRGTGRLRADGADISIHAPQWGATSRRRSTCASKSFQSTHPSGVRPRNRLNQAFFDGFQSTHPSGVRHQIEDGLQDMWNISIHAPQWGATLRLRRLRLMAYRFQSTHPSGVRLNCATPIQIFLFISIHAPQWGATFIRFQRGVPQIVISIHAPQWGATVGGQAAHSGQVISIHAPQWGATPSGLL